MSFSIDTKSAVTLKSEAKALCVTRAGALSYSKALEITARAHGFRDWNTARACLPERVAPPFQIGQRVAGNYLSQPFEGTIIGVQLLTDMSHSRLTVTFDKPVDVVTSQLFSSFRQRVTATVDAYGVSPARTGNGLPQMRLSLL